MKTLIVLLTVMIGFTASAQECGLVKWYDPNKGDGFISPIGKMHGNDLLVTWVQVMFREDGLSKPLQKNDKVIYDRVSGPDGTLAEKVRVVIEFPVGVCD